MRGGSFVDTNIWVYAHLEAPEDDRHPIALRLVTSLTDAVVSPQVLAEYYSVMLKARRDDRWIQENLQVILDYVHCQPVGEKLIRHSWQLRNRYGFSHWDCQVLAAALEAGCTTLYTEDLQHGQQIGRITVTNPFLSDSG
jgi:predicted nucleic acid-binding protein